MSKRTLFTTITPLPRNISRENVLRTLQNHYEMIDLNPLVVDRFPIPPPNRATTEELDAIWYQIVDRIQYLPGTKGSILRYQGCFHDLVDGLQTHVYAPMGLEIRGRWRVAGSLPGEPPQPVELGLGMDVPLQGLYVREDVDMRCNFVMTGFVKKTLKKSHEKLVQRIVELAQKREAAVRGGSSSGGGGGGGGRTMGSALDAASASATPTPTTATTTATTATTATILGSRNRSNNGYAPSAASDDHSSFGPERSRLHPAYRAGAPNLSHHPNGRRQANSTEYLPPVHTSPLTFSFELPSSPIPGRAPAELEG